MSADTRIHVQQAVDNVLIALLQTNISLQLANAGVERSCAIHEGLHSWCESLVAASEAEASAFAREQRRVIAEAASAATTTAAKQNAAAAASTKPKQTPVSSPPGVDTNRTPSAGGPDHAATLRRPPPPKLNSNSDPSSTPSTAATLVSPLAAAAPIPTDPYAHVRITPAAGSTSRGSAAAGGIGGGGRRQFPQQAARPTLLSDEDKRALEFGRMALEEAEQGRIAQEMEDAALLNARNPAQTAGGAAGEEEISGLFGAPKRVDKAVKLSPYLTQINAAAGSKKKKPATTTATSTSASNKKPKSSPASESLSAKKKTPARSPERPPRHSPAQVNAAPAAVFDPANLSLDAILAQAKYVHALEDDDNNQPPAAAISQNPAARSSATTSSRSFVPLAAMVTTAATAAKQRSKPIASPAAVTDASGRKWNPGYGAVTKGFTGSLSDISGRELTGPYVPSSSTASAVLAHRKKVAKANRPSAVGNASDHTAAFPVQHAPVGFHDDGSDAYHEVSHHHSLHHAHPSDDANSVHSYAVHYAASSGTSSAGHSRRSSARFQPPPPPPPPPPSIPAPSTTSSTPSFKASNAFKFPRAFVDLTNRFQLLKQSLQELNERRRNVWNNPNVGPTWKASQHSFLQTAAHLQPSTSSNQSQRAFQIDPESLALSEAYQHQYVSESVDETAESCPTIEARYGPAPFAPLNPWLQYTSIGASPSSPPFQYPFTKSNLALMQKHILAERKSRAQARRASTLGLEPSQSEVNDYASQTLLLFEEDMARLIRARVEESVESKLAQHLEPVLANTAQLSTAEAVPLLKLAYSVLHAGGRLGPRNRHGQARKAAPIFLPRPSAHFQQDQEDDDEPVIRAKSNLWLAADEAAAARAQPEGSIDELNMSREQEEQYQASAEELQAMQDEDLDA